ncbi:MAG: rod shape-determining protein MreD [Thermodesulfobacteriota bacterium]|nr:rod shape-determining protein MreD [Thermodesulfobacteriota bacterium]
MNQLLIYFITGIIFILAQTTLLPSMLETTPNLILLLVLYIGLHEPPLTGAFYAWFLGCFLDVFSGMTLGLYGIIMLLIFCTTSIIGRQLTIDSTMVMIGASIIGTAGQTILLISTSLCFSETHHSWPLILNNLVPQIITNLITVLAIIILQHLLRKLRQSGTNEQGKHAWR